jgi:large subunit ribosomal protein L15
MQIHNIKRIHKNKKRMTVGRGGKRGKTSGRGTKGQNARAGRKKRPEMRDFIKRIPKLRGRGKNIFQSFQIKPYTINLGSIESVYSNGESVTPATLVAKGLLELYKGKKPSVKILGAGEFTKKITVKRCAISKEAKEKIEKAGGKVHA